jgi:dTDP-4-dehydrorhamnose reductase
MNKKILVTGSQGLVGSRFVELYKDKDNLLTPTLSEFNLLDAHLMEAYIKGKNVTTVINFAAFTDVGEGERQRGDKHGLCWKVNVEGTNNLIKRRS